VGQTRGTSEPSRLEIDYPPPGAPNVVVVMLDDVGFGAPGTFGGPVATPALDRVGSAGVIYNQFHTTALCSPSRASFLTGRNHHRVHFGTVAEIAYGFPGYDSRLPRSAATVAEILRANGYGTALFGKAHFTPMWELGPAGPFDRWPTGVGFERFYGFLGGAVSQWEPALYDQTTPISPHIGRDAYHLTEDLADKAIAWMRRQKAGAPRKPFFVFFSPGATHNPHHVGQDWVEKFAGRFDRGWDELREDIFQQQLETGIIPRGTNLTRRPDQIPAWADYPDRYKPVASRLMEVYAGFLGHTDAQVGRLIDALVELEEWENTLFIYLTGDNGASAAGTIHGAWSTPSYANGFPEDPEWLLEHIEDFGTSRCENHFNVGWAWALDSPFQWMKQVASHFGGTRNGLAISWPQGIDARGELRSQFHHVIDLAPTILETVGVRFPESVDGIEQQPVDGVSMAYSFDNHATPSKRRTQYFEILGNRAIYHDGWVAACFHGRVPWVRSDARPFGEGERWELYRVDDDFSQSVDLAGTYPEKLAELKGRFEIVAEENGVFPLSDETQTRLLPESKPSYLEDLAHVVLHDGDIRLPELASVNLKNTSFKLTARVYVPDVGVEGVIICQGGVMGGWSLYTHASRLIYHYNLFGHKHTVVESNSELPAGDVEVALSFDYDGGGVGKGGGVIILVDGKVVGRGRLEETVPFLFSDSGESLDVGVDTGSPVGPYPSEFRFTGSVHSIDVELIKDGSRAIMSDGEAEALKNAITTQQ